MDEENIKEITSNLQAMINKLIDDFKCKSVDNSNLEDIIVTLKVSFHI